MGLYYQNTFSTTGGKQALTGRQQGSAVTTQSSYLMGHCIQFLSSVLSGALQDRSGRLWCSEYLLGTLCSASQKQWHSGVRVVPLWLLPQPMARATSAPHQPVLLTQAHVTTVAPTHCWFTCKWKLNSSCPVFNHNNSLHILLDTKLTTKLLASWARWPSLLQRSWTRRPFWVPFQLNPVIQSYHLIIFSLGWSSIQLQTRSWLTTG